MPIFAKNNRTMYLMALSLVLIGCDDSEADAEKCKPDNTKKDAATEPENDTITSQHVSHLLIQEPDESTTFMTHHEITITVGVTASGPAHDAQLHWGLMEEPNADATTADLADLAACTVGIVSLKFHGGKDEQVFATQHFTIPNDCLPEGTDQKTFNLWTSLDTFDEIIEVKSGGENDNLVVFNNREAANAANQACRDMVNDKPGCVFSLKVKSTEGINLQFRELTSQSSVAVLYPEEDHEDVIEGTNERNHPLTTVSSTLTVLGQEHLDADGDFKVDDDNSLNAPATITYTIKATNAADSPLPLTIHKGHNEASGHDPSATVEKLVTGSPTHFTHELFAEGQTRAALESGPWAAEHEFTIEGCVSTSEKEVSTGDNGTSDNCQKEQVVLVRSAVNASLADSYSLNAGWTKSYGDSDTVQLNVDLGTENVLNLSGASSATRAHINVESLVGHISIFNAIANGDAFIAVVGSGADVAVDVFGISVYSYSNRIPEISYARDFSITKSLCATFSYGVIVVSLDVSLCLSGTAGIDVKDFTIKAKQGSDAAPFAESTKIGTINASVKPYTNIDGVVTATADITVARAGASGTIRLIGIDLPLEAQLKWGLVSGPKLVVIGDGTWSLNLVSLNGYFDLFADTRSIDWCSSWLCDYPCGFSWNNVYYKRLGDWSGTSINQNLLTRHEQLTLQ